MQYQNETYRENQDYKFNGSQSRHNELVPYEDNDSHRSANIALALGALAVAGGLTYFLIKQTTVSTKQKPTAQGGIRAARSITVMKSPAELYTYWRRLENLPHIMSHLERVEETDPTHSHWVAKAPLGTKVEWDAEITEDIPNQKIAWRSLPESQIPNEGYVEFINAGEGRGTVIHTSLSYQPPAGALGAAVAKLFGQEPNQQIAKDLRKFQQMMELGEVPTTEGQPVGKGQPNSSGGRKQAQAA
jgi:uncharacterized membrane protein